LSAGEVVVTEARPSAGCAEVQLPGTVAPAAAAQPPGNARPAIRTHPAPTARETAQTSVMMPIADAFTAHAAPAAASVAAPHEPSRVFILRPVATTLLMVAILIVGAIAYLQLPLSALPKWLSDDPGADVLPRREPEVITSAITDR